MEGAVPTRSRVSQAAPILLPTLETSTGVMRLPRQVVDPSTPFHEVVVSVVRRKWIILAVALLGGVLAGLAGIARPVLFEATTQLIIDLPSRSSPTESVQELLDSSVDDHLTMLSSQALLRRVLAALHKMPVAITARNGSPTAVASNSTLSTQSWTSSALRNLAQKIWRQNKPQNPEAAEAAELKALRKGMRVGQELRSRVITVGFTDTDPQRAALITNTIAQVYVDYLIQKRRASDQQELDSIVATLPRVQGDLVDATNRLETYRLAHGAVDQSAANNAANEMAELSRQISLSKADLAAAVSHLQDIRDLRNANAPVSAIANEIGSPVLTGLVARAAGAAADKDLNDAINREIEQDITGLAAQIDIYRAQTAALEGRKNVLDAVVSETASRLSGLRALEPQVAVVTQRYNDLLGRQQDLIRRIAAPTPGVSFLSMAWPPSNPTTLSPIFLIPPGMVVFGLMAAALGLVRDRFNKTLRSEAEAEAALGIPCAALLPRLPRLHAGQLRQLVVHAQNSKPSRAVTSLLVTAARTKTKGHPHILLITSSVRDDGKAQLAWSLALAATRLAPRVLFLDLDRKDAALTSDFCGQFGVTKAHCSFVDYLCDRCTLKDAATRMPEIGIDLISAPAPGIDLLALLSRVDASRVRNELRKTYDFVFINGPPGLDGPQAGLVTYWADTVFFAIRWAKTRRSVARGVLDELRAAGTASVPVGSVLTGVNLKAHARYRFEDSADLLIDKAG